MLQTERCWYRVFCKFGYTAWSHNKRRFIAVPRERTLQSQNLQLGNLLEELGVDVTEERLREAFSELDRGGRGVDGLLSLEEFEAWWTSGTTM